MILVLVVTEILRALLLVAGGALWAAAVVPRGRDPRQRWRVRLASASLAAMVTGSILLGLDPWGVAVLAAGLVGLLASADDGALTTLYA